ncbi:MAG: hypothetical protein KDA29_09505 [Phycisphaerales bacterium]|nr:hypothetical protein [Phycisphaerales bacterium]
MSHKKSRSFPALLATIVGAAASLAHAQSAITYQGRLNDAGAPADGTYDILFDLYTDPTPGGPEVIVTTELVTNVTVVDGLFTVEIPFNPLAFNGDDRFLQIACRPTGTAIFTPLYPRQRLTDVPQAVHADVANAIALPAELTGFTTAPLQALFSVENTNLTSGIAIRAESQETGILAVAGDPTGAPSIGLDPVAISAVGEQIGVAGSSGSGVGIRGSSATGYGGQFDITETGSAIFASTSALAADAHAGFFQNFGSSNAFSTLYVNTLSTQPFAFGVQAGIESSSPGIFSAAVRGENKGTAGSGIGVWGSHAGSGWGVYGTSPSGGRGVYGFVIGPGGAGVYGRGTNGASAGYFEGDVTITGVLSKGSGTFKIDHPLDPANMYLSHSFVESPDMKNIYDGVVTLDEQGSATVTMPTYFDALNTEFRYQLTCIGGYAPVFIAEEINERQFSIAGGKPGLKVSWQITGIRQDPFALANPVRVEEEKSSDEKGLYLHPELYGQPQEKGIGYRAQPMPDQN